jgi:hypothetical protein
MVGFFLDISTRDEQSLVAKEEKFHCRRNAFVTRSELCCQDSNQTGLASTSIPQQRRHYRLQDLVFSVLDKSTTRDEQNLVAKGVGLRYQRNALLTRRTFCCQATKIGVDKSTQKWLV